MDKERARDRKIGRHIVHFTDPDLFHIRFIGDVRGSDFGELGEFFREAAGKIFLLVDATQMGTVSAEARLVKQIPISAGSAVFGAPFQARVALSILNKVYMMVNKDQAVPLGFFDTEEEARAWLARVRRVD